MSVRIAIAFGASLALVACGSSAASAMHGVSTSTHWNDASLDAVKLDYFFSAMEKMSDYAMSHRDVDLDSIAIDGGETEADYAKRVNADPKLREIFAATGIDPLRYANVTGVMAGAMLGVGLAGKNVEPSKLPQAAQYYLAHKAQIDGRMAKFQEKAEAMAKQMGADDSE